MFDTPPSWRGSRWTAAWRWFYSRFDLGNGWEQFPHAYSYGLTRTSRPCRLGTNVIVYADHALSVAWRETHLR